MAVIHLPYLKKTLFRYYFNRHIFEILYNTWILSIHKTVGHFFNIQYSNYLHNNIRYLHDFLTFQSNFKLLISGVLSFFESGEMHFLILDQLNLTILK